MCISIDKESKAYLNCLSFMWVFLYVSHNETVKLLIITVVITRAH
jgi:hypothetical protein